jgi:hypothetical protein
MPRNWLRGASRHSLFHWRCSRRGSHHGMLAFLNRVHRRMTDQFTGWLAGVTKSVCSILASSFCSRFSASA